jgi:hypothetical protein
MPKSDSFKLIREQQKINYQKLGFKAPYSLTNFAGENISPKFAVGKLCHRGLSPVACFPEGVVLWSYSVPLRVLAEREARILPPGRIPVAKFASYAVPCGRHSLSSESGKPSYRAGLTTNLLILPRGVSPWQS